MTDSAPIALAVQTRIMIWARVMESWRVKNGLPFILKEKGDVLGKFEV